MKKTCSILMIVAMITMMFGAQISHATVEMCVKHCIPNQCMKVATHPDPMICEAACKKLCNEQLAKHEEYIVPVKERSTLYKALCKWLNCKQ
ncbi:unnamed protein product [Thlaspi arvense]|uniref:Plant thionin family protein n=1 Tax=Thlaspi arvense TaxID=13288 RepID=A0AAU9R8N2_THLAR|nr:unnamed protein product [Thlaspi arvense]